MFQVDAANRDHGSMNHNSNINMDDDQSLCSPTRFMMSPYNLGSNHVMTSSYMENASAANNGNRPINDRFTSYDYAEAAAGLGQSATVGGGVTSPIPLRANSGASLDPYNMPRNNNNNNQTGPPYSSSMDQRYRMAMTENILLKECIAQLRKDRGELADDISVLRHKLVIRDAEINTLRAFSPQHEGAHHYQQNQHHHHHQPGSHAPDPNSALAGNTAVSLNGVVGRNHHLQNMRMASSPILNADAHMVKQQHANWDQEEEEVEDMFTDQPNNNNNNNYNVRYLPFTNSNNNNPSFDHYASRKISAGADPSAFAERVARYSSRSNPSGYLMNATSPDPTTKPAPMMTMMMMQSQQQIGTTSTVRRALQQQQPQQSDHFYGNQPSSYRLPHVSLGQQNKSISLSDLPARGSPRLAALNVPNNYQFGQAIGSPDTAPRLNTAAAPMPAPFLQTNGNFRASSTSPSPAMKANTPWTLSNAPICDHSGYVNMSTTHTLMPSCTNVAAASAAAISSNNDNGMAQEFPNGAQSRHASSQYLNADLADKIETDRDQQVVDLRSNQHTESSVAVKGASSADSDRQHMPLLSRSQSLRIYTNQLNEFAPTTELKRKINQRNMGTASFRRQSTKNIRQMADEDEAAAAKEIGTGIKQQICSSHSSDEIHVFASSTAESFLQLPVYDFGSWDRDVVSAWLYEIGLGYCVMHARKWVNTGADLLHATKRELVKELNIKNMMHMKKLIVHMLRRTIQPVIAASEFCHPSVQALPWIHPPRSFSIRAWLEDLGLFQYHVNFEQALVDVHCLNQLTLEDVVLGLGINNELHVLSLRRGLQMLHNINFDLTSLCRRPVQSSLVTSSSPNQAYKEDAESDVAEDDDDDDMIDIDIVAPRDGNNNAPRATMRRQHSPMRDHLHPCTGPKSSINRKAGSLEPPSRSNHAAWLQDSSSSSSAKNTSTGANLSSSNQNVQMQSANTATTTSSSSGASSGGNISSVSPSSLLQTMSNQYTALEICHWTQHRVMAWLQSIDLAEYTAELRGSGIHGALIVLEDRFNPDILAKILHIPPNKSLLRRHLREKFIDLVGNAVWTRKQAVTSQPNFCQMTLHGKMKLNKKRGYNFFGSMRRKKSNSESSEYDLLCPPHINSWNVDIFQAKTMTLATTRVDNTSQRTAACMATPDMASQHVDEPKQQLMLEETAIEYDLQDINLKDYEDAPASNV